MYAETTKNGKENESNVNFLASTDPDNKLTSFVLHVRHLRLI